MLIIRAWATCGKTSYLRCQTCTALCLYVNYSLAQVTEICVRQTQSLSPIVTGKKVAHEQVERLEEITVKEYTYTRQEILTEILNLRTLHPLCRFLPPQGTHRDGYLAKAE